MITTTRTQALTYQQKIELRLESPHLRRPRPIAVILIEFPIDWCIKQVQQWVRRRRKKQKRQRQNRHVTYLANKKSSYDSSRHIYAAPKPLSWSSLNSLSIDVSNRCNNGLEDIKWSKNVDTISVMTTYRLAKKNQKWWIIQAISTRISLVWFLSRWYQIHVSGMCLWHRTSTEYNRCRGDGYARNRKRIVVVSTHFDPSLIWNLM